MHINLENIKNYKNVPEHVKTEVGQHALTHWAKSAIEYFWEEISEIHVYSHLC